MDVSHHVACARMTGHWFCEVFWSITASLTRGPRWPRPRGSPGPVRAHAPSNVGPAMRARARGQNPPRSSRPLGRVDARWWAGLTRPTPFPVAARRTGRAGFPHPALSGIMPSPTEGRADTGCSRPTELSPRRDGGESLDPRHLLSAQPPAGPTRARRGAGAPTAAVSRVGATASSSMHARLPPSLSHGMPRAASRPLSALPDSFVNRPSRAPASTAQGSFPPPALPGFTSTTTPSATPTGRFRASRHHRWPAPPRQPPRGASRVAHDPPTHMPSPLPRRNRWVRVSLSFPNGGGLPRNSGGSASALPFSRPA